MAKMVEMIDVFVPRIALSINSAALICRVFGIFAETAGSQELAENALYSAAILCVIGTLSTAVDIFNPVVRKVRSDPDTGTIRVINVATTIATLAVMVESI